MANNQNSVAVGGAMPVQRSAVAYGWEVPPGATVAPAVPRTSAATVLYQKPTPKVIGLVIVGLLLVIGALVGWQILKRKPQAVDPGIVTTQQEPGPAPLPELKIPTPPQPEATASAPVSTEAWPGTPVGTKARAKRPAAAATAPVDPAVARKTAEISRLQSLARNAYGKSSYADSPDASALAYSRQVLELDPTNADALLIYNNSYKAARDQVHQAMASKDFGTAHRIADSMAAILPGERAVADLQSGLASAEKADGEARRAAAAPPASIVFRVYHLHSGKELGTNTQYCRGTLSVVGDRLKYAGQTALDGKVDTFDIACSEIREVKKNSRFGSRENGFHVRTDSGSINFVPEDFSPAHLTALASACSR